MTTDFSHTLPEGATLAFGGEALQRARREATTCSVSTLGIRYSCSFSMAEMKKR